MGERPYPIQDGPSVPWSYMTPHESTAQKNHGQSIEYLASRGGLSCGEAELIVTGQPLYPKDGEWNWAELKRRWVERAERINNAYLAAGYNVTPTPPAVVEVADGELWSFLKSVMSQGAAIQQDYAAGNHPTYEHYARRMDIAASERVDELRRLLAPKENDSE